MDNKLQHYTSLVGRKLNTLPFWFNPSFLSYEFNLATIYSPQSAPATVAKRQLPAPPSRTTTQLATK